MLAPLLVQIEARNPTMEEVEARNPTIEGEARIPTIEAVEIEPRNPTIVEDTGLLCGERRSAQEVVLSVLGGSYTITGAPRRGPASGMAGTMVARQVTPTFLSHMMY